MCEFYPQCVTLCKSVLYCVARDVRLCSRPRRAEIPELSTHTPLDVVLCARLAQNQLAWVSAKITRCKRLNQYNYDTAQKFLLCEGQFICIFVVHTSPSTLIKDPACILARGQSKVPPRWNCSVGHSRLEK